ncbi:hypothetical protein MN116_001912 [Schistosoma mekongi]|uniref:non-specific serine/threonine protein kinase n=1 Tax=Schistosoma mekongi TaxID=38744 RepID=A0AAE1ZJE5_SCHME|nr:hypothetical protein MN116_001912 [Schistosoma mekongi]
MNKNYPREIHIQNGKAKRNGSASSNFKTDSKLSRNVTIHWCEPEMSYHELSREYTGVDIRNNEVQNNNYISAPGGQLRSAISEVEGLDRYNKHCLEERSTTPTKKNGQINDHANKSDANHASAESFSSIKRNPSHKNDKKSIQKRPDGLTPFENLCQNFSKNSTYKNEMKTGKRLGFYRFILDIGRGNFSKVKLALHSLLNIEVAVKVIDRTKFDEKTRRLLSQELINMERLHHPHIIRAYEVHEVLQRWHLVMEYAPKGELNSYLKRFGRLDEKTSRNYSSQILSALDHLHNNGVVHRDLKAENVFIVSNLYVKLGDFGFSKCVDPDAALTTFCGSPPYAAPELFVSDSYTGPAVDLWALGVLIFYMVVGNLPFEANSLHKIKRLILSGDYRIPAYITPNCQALISGLLTTPVERRYNISKAKDSLWFTGIDWQHLLEHKEPTPDEIDDASARHLLKKWWDVDDSELNKALSEGPKNKLTGIYRILRNKGLQYKQDPTLPDQKYKNKKGRVKHNGSHGANKQKLRPVGITHKELTTVDLRDQKSIKNGENTTRTCNIL